jgi:4,5-DOPA dioxygenase extradiol
MSTATHTPLSASTASMPSWFISHGAPTYALDGGLAAQQLHEVAQQLPRPQAICMVSPHWMTPGRSVRVATTAQPATLHDFGGFAPKLYELQYPAPGHPLLAQQALGLLQQAGWQAHADERWGLDHGAWVPLMHAWPQADVPVFQVSLPQAADAADALALGRALAPLGGQGVLVIGSGSLTHNLAEFRGTGVAHEQPYVTEFVAWVRAAVQRGDVDALVHTLMRAPHATRAHPSDDHFLPLLVALGAAPVAAGPLPTASPVTVLAGGTRFGMLSMESYLWGRAIALPKAIHSNAIN